METEIIPGEHQILVIENDIEQTRSIDRLLAGLGYRLIIAANGVDALQIIEGTMPACVLLATDLPDIGGLEILAEIGQRCSDTKPAARVILALTERDEYIMEQGILHGAYDFIHKPYDHLELRLKIHNAIAQLVHDRCMIRYCEELKQKQEKSESERNQLAKYFSRDLTQAILSGDIPTSIGGEITTASILFCDLRNSTGIARSIEPSLFSKFLSNLFTDITDLIYGESGSVNKFLGDGILATFGCPRPIADDALHCARAALNIRKYLENFNQFRPKYLADPIEMGVGIARGECFTGNIGSVNMIEYTVLGDPVNVASRLESLTKLAKLDILMDGAIVSALSGGATTRPVRIKSARGILRDIDIYHLVGLA